MRNLFNRASPPNRRSVELEQRQLNDATRSAANTRSPSDPLSAGSRERFATQNFGFIAFGRVVDSVAYARTYKVQCERGLGVLRCCDSGQTGFTPVGARQLNTYPIGSGVLIYYVPGAAYHVILCGVPDWMVSATDAISDFVVQGSNCGVQVDNVHRFPFGISNSIIDFSAGRPADSLQHGEYGAVTETGLRIIMDSFHVQIAVDETTGLVLVYGDRYARLSGHNLDLRSSGSVREDRDDEGEFSSVEGFTAYPWEALGAVARGNTAFVENTVTDCQQSDPSISRYEPIDPKQLGIYRDRRFRGYLGQGEKRIICTPNPEETIHTLDSDGLSLFGLLEENRLFDGTYAARSARGFFFVKSPAIPVPKRKSPPESRSGDRTDDDYKSCGLYGAGDDHIVTSTPDATANPDSHLIEPAAILDLVAHTFNWKGLHQFYYHAKDWYLAEESELPDIDATVVPTFSDLNTSQFLPAAATLARHVDDRYGDVDYSCNMSVFGLLPNGSIVLLDGWGTEDRSVAGMRYINVPGDIVVSAGRNIVLQAGGSVIVKGHEGVDLSSSHGSVRAKAEETVYILGGNGGCGGVVIESRADGVAFELSDTPGETEDIVGGIVLRAKTSAIVAVGNQVFVSTAAWGDNADGHIVIDASTATLAQRSKYSYRKVATWGLDVIGDSASIEYWPTQVIFDQSLATKADILAKNNLAVCGSGLFGLFVSSNDHTVLSMDQVTEIDTITTALTDRDVTSEQTSFQELVTWLYDSTDIGDIEFFFRNEAMLRTEEFTICEPIWSQLARLGSAQTVHTWTEPVVAGDSHPDSAPYPGNTKWRTDSAFGQQDLSLFDPTTMTAVDRGASYETAELAAAAWSTLEANWPIVTTWS